MFFRSKIKDDDYVKKTWCSTKGGYVDDIVRLTDIFGQLRGDVRDHAPVKQLDMSTVRQDVHHYPKFSIFDGADGKSEANWETFRYKVLTVLEGKGF